MRVRVYVFAVFGLTYENEKHTQPKGCTILFAWLPTGIGPGPLGVGFPQYEKIPIPTKGLFASCSAEPLFCRAVEDAFIEQGKHYFWVNQYLVLVHRTANQGDGCVYYPIGCDWRHHHHIELGKSDANNL